MSERDEGRDPWTSRVRAERTLLEERAAFHRPKSYEGPTTRREVALAFLRGMSDRQGSEAVIWGVSVERTGADGWIIGRRGGPLTSTKIGTAEWAAGLLVAYVGGDAPA